MLDPPYTNRTTSRPYDSTYQPSHLESPGNE